MRRRNTAYQSLRGGRIGISSLLSGLNLRLKVRRRVEIFTRIPCTLSLYIIHTHRDLILGSVDCYSIGWVGVATLTRLSRTCTSLKFSTYLQRSERNKMATQKIKLNVSFCFFFKLHKSIWLLELLSSALLRSLQFC